MNLDEIIDCWPEAGVAIKIGGDWCDPDYLDDSYPSIGHTYYLQDDGGAWRAVEYGFNYAVQTGKVVLLVREVCDGDWRLVETIPQDSADNECYADLKYNDANRAAESSIAYLKWVEAHAQDPCNVYGTFSLTRETLVAKEWNLRFKRVDNDSVEVFWSLRIEDSNGRYPKQQWDHDVALPDFILDYARLYFDPDVVAWCTKFSWAELMARSASPPSREVWDRSNWRDWGMLSVNTAFPAWLSNPSHENELRTLARRNAMIFERDLAASRGNRKAS